mgnify:CR=1 FL=1|jgi:hypothetical protein
MTDNDMPIGEDTRPKDRVKQGLSSSTSVEEWDCTNRAYHVIVEGTVQRLVTVQAKSIEEADKLALEEFKSLLGTEEAYIVL